MGHDEAQARQAALLAFVHLIKASNDDVVSEVEAISFTGDISQLSNYELSVVIQQLQAQLFSNLNPHRPGGIGVNAEAVERTPEPEPAPAPKPVPAPTPTPTAPTAPAPEPEPTPKARLSLFTLYQEVGLDSDKLNAALCHYTHPALMKCARAYRVASKSELEKFTTRQLIEALVKRAEGTNWDAAPAQPAPAPTPAKPADAWRTRMEQISKAANPAPTPEPEPEGLSWLDNPEAFTL